MITVLPRFPSKVKDVSLFQRVPESCHFIYTFKNDDNKLRTRMKNVYSESYTL